MELELRKRNTKTGEEMFLYQEEKPVAKLNLINLSNEKIKIDDFQILDYEKNEYSKGFGSILFDKVIKYIKAKKTETKEISLEAVSAFHYLGYGLNQKELVSFYERRGFKIDNTGEIPGWFIDIYSDLSKEEVYKKWKNNEKLKTPMILKIAR